MNQAERLQFALTLLNRRMLGTSRMSGNRWYFAVTNIVSVTDEQTRVNLYYRAANPRSVWSSTTELTVENYNWTEMPNGH